MHFVLWGTSHRKTCNCSGGSSYVSMHFVLWGTSHRTPPKRSPRIRLRVSMHFVLWGTSHPKKAGFVATRTWFQCTSCFGVLLIHWRNNLAWQEVRFNALRALGYFSSNVGTGRSHRTDLFQCTSCFGVLLIRMVAHSRGSGFLFQCTSCFGVLLIQWYGW